MAKRLGKIEIYLSSTATGLPLANVTIDIRRQGAQIVSGGPTVFTIDNPGAIRHSSESGAPASDSCICYKADGTVRDANIRAVTALSATSITVATGFTGTADDDRISPVSNLPTIYEDSEGDTAIASSRLTTDANGYAAAWAPGGPYDAIVNPTDAAGQPTQYVLTDQEARGADKVLTNSWPNAVNGGFHLEPLRVFAATDDLFAIHAVGGADRFKVMGDGEIVAGVSGAAHNLTGSLTVSGGILGNTLQSTLDTTIGGLIVMTTAASRLTPGATSFAVRNTGDTLNNLLVAEAGDVTVRRDSLFRRVLSSVTPAPTATADAAWGTGASAVTVANGSDMKGKLSLTSGTGPSANPSITLTFGTTYGSNPTVVVAYGNGAIATGTRLYRVSSVTATQAIFVLEGTPNASTAYDLYFVVIGHT